MTKSTTLELSNDQIIEIFSQSVKGPEYVPSRYIQEARVTTNEGVFYNFNGDEFRIYCDSKPKGFKLGDIELDLDLSLFNQEVQDIVKSIFGCEEII